MNFDTSNSESILPWVKSYSSHICQICGEMEFPKADMLTNEFWICFKCCDKLKHLLYEEE